MVAIWRWRLPSFWRTSQHLGGTWHKKKSLDVVYIYTHPHIPTKQYGNHIMEQIHFRFLHELNMARRCQSFLNRHLGKMASGPNHGMVCPSKHIEEGCIVAYIELALQALAADRLMWPARPKWHALWLFLIYLKTYFIVWWLFDKPKSPYIIKMIKYA